MTSGLNIRISADASQASAELRRLQENMARVSGSTDSARASLAGFGQTLAAALSAREVLQAADAWASINAQLKISTGSAQAGAAAYGDVVKIALQSGQALGEVGNVYKRISDNAFTLGLSQKDVAAATTTVAQAMALSGGSAASSQAALVQFGQALSSGTLRGEELNSVLEQAPRLARVMADGLNVPVGKLRELAEQGKITSDEIVKALSGQAGKVADEFGQLPVTIGRALTNLKTSFTDTVGSLEKSSGAFGTLAKGVDSLAGNMGILVTAGGALGAVLTGKVVSGMAASATGAIANQASLQNLARTELAAAEAAYATANAQMAVARSMAGSTTATAALTVATQRLAATQTAAAATGKAAMAIGALGGPIGIVTTALILGATAWSVWGNKTDEATREAARSAKENIDSVISKLAEMNGRIGDITRKSYDSALKSANDEVIKVGGKITDLNKQIDQLNAKGEAERPTVAGNQAKEYLAELREREKKALQEISDLRAKTNEVGINSLKKFREENATGAEKIAQDQVKAQNQFAEAIKITGGVFDRTNGEHLATLSTLKAKLADLAKTPASAATKEASATIKARADAIYEGYKESVKIALENIKSAKDQFLLSTSDFIVIEGALKTADIEAQITALKTQLSAEKDNHVKIKIEGDIAQLEQALTHVPELMATATAKAAREAQKNLDEIAHVAGKALDPVQAKLTEFAKTYGDKITQAAVDGHTAYLQAAQSAVEGIVGQAVFDEAKTKFDALFADMQQQVEAVRQEAAKDGGLFAGLAGDEQVKALHDKMIPELESLRDVMKSVKIDSPINEKTVSETGRALQKITNEISPTWKKISDDLERGLTDSLFRSFESGKDFGKTFLDSLKNLFKTTVLKLAVQGIVSGVTGSFGLGGGSAVGGGTVGSVIGGIGAAKDAYSLYSTASTVYGYGQAAMAGAGLTGTEAVAAAQAYSQAGMTGIANSIEAGYLMANGSLASTGAAVEASAAALTTSFEAGLGLKAGTLVTSSSTGVSGAGAASGASAGLMAVGWLAAAYFAIDWLESQGGGTKFDSTAISNNGIAGTNYATNLVSKGSLNTYAIAGSEPYKTTPAPADAPWDWTPDTASELMVMSNHLQWQENSAGNARDSEYYTKVLAPAVSGAQELVKSLGGTLEGQLIAASRVTVDALGKAPDNFITGLTQVLEDGTRKVVLDSVSDGERGKTADNIVTEMSRLSLAYVQAASDIDPIFKNIISGINLATADGEKMQDALARINGAAVLINLSESLTGTNNPLAALFPKIFKEGVASVDLNALWTSAPKSVENKTAVSAAQSNFSAVEAGYKAGTQSAEQLAAAQTRLTQAQSNAAAENSSIAAQYPTISGAMIDYIRTLDVSKLTVEEMAKAGEQLKTLDGVSDLFDKMGMGAKSLSTAFLEAIGGTVTEAMKMLPQLQANMNAYYEGAYTPAEKLANASKDVTRVFDGLSVAVPTSIEGFRGIVEALKRGTVEGDQTFATLMSVFPAFATLTKSIEDLGLAAGQASADFAEGQAKLRGGTNQGSVLQAASVKAMAELNTGLRLGDYSAVNDGSVALKDTLSITQAAFDAMLPAQQKQVLAAQAAAQALQDFSVSVSNAARDANLSLAQEALKLKGGTDAQIAQLGVDSALAKVNDWRKEQGWDAVSGDFLRNNQAVIQGMNNPNSAGFSTAYTDYANLTKDYLGTLNSLNSANQSSSTNTATNTATETALPTHGLQIRLLELQSVRDSIKAQEALNLRRADELQSLAAADQAIQKQIFVLEDLAAATAAATAMGDFMKGIADSIADFGKSDTQKQIDAIGKTYDDNIKKAHELATAAGHSVTVAGVTTYDATAKAQEAEIARLAQLQKQALMDALLKTSSDGVESMGLTPLQKQLYDLEKGSTLITQSVKELGAALGWTAEQISVATAAATGYNAAQAQKLGDDFVDGLKSSLAALGMSASEKQMLDLAAALEANKVSAAALGRGIEEATQLYTAQVAKLRNDFTAGLDESIASYGLSDYAQQVRAVEQTYQDSIATAKTLKLGQSELNKIERIRAESLQTLAQAEADAAKAARQTAESNLRSVYQGLAEGYQQTVEAAKTAESTLRSAYEARVAEITSTAERFSDFVASIREFRAALATGEQSALNPAERAAASYAAMQDAIAQARGGDVAAAGKIQGAATDYLKLAKDQSASRLDYARAVAKTQIDLQALEGSAAAQGDVSTQQLAALKLQVTGLIDLNQTEANAFESALAGYKLAQSAAWTAQGSLDQLKAQVGALIQLDDTGKTTLQQAIAEYQLAVSAEITANSALNEAKAQTTLLSGILSAITNENPIDYKIIPPGESLADRAAANAANAAAMWASVANPSLPTASFNWHTDPVTGLPAFASGGYHIGGLRLVGEDGPEVEATGPSRIYSHSQTKDLFSRLQNPQSNNEALVAEIRELRALIGALIGPLTATALNTSEQARLLKRWENIGPKAARAAV